MIVQCNKCIAFLYRQPTTIRKLRREIQPNRKCSRPRSRDATIVQDRSILLNHLRVRWKSATLTARQTNVFISYKQYIILLVNTQNFGSSYCSLWYDSVLSLIAEHLLFIMLWLHSPSKITSISLYLSIPFYCLDIVTEIMVFLIMKWYFSSAK